MNLAKKRGFLYTIILALFIFLPSSVLYAVDIAHENTICFYNPETNINNFASLKMGFDSYLSKFGAYQFQPFKEKAIFEKFIANKGGIFLLSSWHYRLINKKFPLEPLLIGVSNGKSTQRKILSVKKQIKSLDLLKGKKIAAAGNKDYIKNILRQILGNDNDEILDSLKLMIVPKDIDALMVVGFGMASAALTTESSLEKLKKINPKQYRLLMQIGNSREMLMTIVATANNPDLNSNALMEVLEKMGTLHEGENKLRMLGLDGWRRLNQKELKVLKQ